MSNTFLVDGETLKSVAETAHELNYATQVPRGYRIHHVRLVPGDEAALLPVLDLYADEDTLDLSLSVADEDES